LGIDITSHRARSLSRVRLRDVELVIGFEREHVALAVSDGEARPMRALYQPLIANGTKVIELDLATAELAKHALNTCFALKISFTNAVARLCERADADVVAVADVMGSDPRIGRAFLDAGIGYGARAFRRTLGRSIASLLTSATSSPSSDAPPHP
jgi:UDP-glucose 6-dehydrogenase